MSHPPSKEELDRINKELEKLRKPKPPTPTLRPDGNLRAAANRVDKDVIEAREKELRERADLIKERFASAKKEMEKGRERFRER